MKVEAINKFYLKDGEICEVKDFIDDNSDKGKSYTFVVRKDNETNVYSYGFVGTQAMARPVRCIRE